MKGYSPIIARRWATASISPQQLVQMARDLNLLPEDARYHSIMLTGNQLDGFAVQLTYESDSLEYSCWEERPQEPLVMFQEANLDSSDDCLSGWEEEDES